VYDSTGKEKIAEVHPIMKIAEVESEQVTLPPSHFGATFLIGTTLFNGVSSLFTKPDVCMLDPGVYKVLVVMMVEGGSVTSKRLLIVGGKPESLYWESVRS